MTRTEAIEELQDLIDYSKSTFIKSKPYINALEMAISELKKRTWNNHQVACLLADMFGDTCACNYNSIDEWLPDLCDFKDTCCPNPVGVACWEQFLKHSKARYCECGYEMR